MGVPGLSAPHDSFPWQEELGLPSLSTAGSSRRQCWSQELDQLRERQAQLKVRLVGTNNGGVPSLVPVSQQGALGGT